MNLAHYPFNEEQTRLITQAADTLYEKLGNRPTKAWFNAIDKDVVLHHILSGEADAAVIDNSYLVVFSIGTPWYSRTVFIEEKLVLRLAPGADFSIVVNFLELLAKHYNASYVAVGSALAFNDRALARLYARYGYQQQCATLMKATA